MPLHAERPIVRVEHSSMRTIETRNTENLFGLWSVFARCSPAMEDGKRYENMAWRLWSRETFCCQPDNVVAPQWSFEQQLPAEMPELSTSVASDDSNLEAALTSTSRSDSTSASRPDLRRHDSATSQARGRHMTPIGLEKVVNSIQEKRFLEPLSPLPPQLAAPIRAPAEVTTPRPSSPPTTARRIPESSTSTVATTQGSEAMSPPVGSEASASTDMSHHSVVRGFERGHISTSIRSTTNLNPTPILKSSASFVARPAPSKLDLGKKKQPMFTLGGSSDEDAASSFEAYSLKQRSSLTENLRNAPAMRKTTSFKKEVVTRTYQDMTSESDGAIESDSEDEVDESAIEDDDDSEAEWEDEDNEEEDSVPSSLKEMNPFQRVESSANLTSRRSLLTTQLHEGDRAQALQNAASRSSPAIRRSRTTTPNGPSTGNSPQEEGLMMRQQSRPKPIMTTTNVHPPAMSPRSTRRNMMQQELTGSLRQNLLWERQQKNATSNAVAKRQQSAVSLPALRRAATTSNIPGITSQVQQSANPSSSFKDTNSVDAQSNYFDSGLNIYHVSGW
ncbi:DUF1752-domain-containing protein [Ophiobolus disseminans]|uniref:DUF1752-domain-containing protein n=1 Tax=Ophiobolus disseminans TaxID=1469910 RepID=A0A6A6ZWQ1_9PLEO|nr:DUF1752-domain-containing protein [Ophiobolus disseminans]